MLIAISTRVASASVTETGPVESTVGGPRLNLTVHRQQKHGSSPQWSAAHHPPVDGIGLQMCRPEIGTRIEQGAFLLGLGINRHDMGRFAEVTRPTGQGEVLHVVASTADDRLDVIDFKREVEHGFRSVAILAAMACPPCHLRIERIHRFNSSAKVAVRAADARTSISINASNSCCLSAENGVP